MQRIKSVQNFKQVLPSQAVTFEVQEAHLQENGRRILLRVNAPEDVALYTTSLPERMDRETGELLGRHFLATVKAGFDEVDFVYTGDFALHASGEVWLDTYEGSTFVVEPSDFETYARVFERPEEDPRVAEYRALQRQMQRERDYQRQLDRIEIEERIAAAIEQVKANVIPPATTPPTPVASPAAGGTAVGTQGADGTGRTTDGTTGGEPNAGT